MNLARLVLALAGLLVSVLALADGRIERVPTREGVTVPVYWEEAPGAKATVLLFSGGRGGFGAMKGGRPDSRNFLIRSIPHFLDAGLNVAAFGRNSDRPDIDPYFRLSAEHAADMAAVIAAVKKLSDKPVWLVGTSRGTTSVAAAAVKLKDSPIAGIALTSSVTSFREEGAIGRFDLASIRVPVLVMHHEKDGCRVCQASDAKRFFGDFSNAPAKRFVLATAGADPTGDECEAWHWHGYIGMEKEAVGMIADFIRAPGP